MKTFKQRFGVLFYLLASGLITVHLWGQFNQLRTTEQSQANYYRVTRESQPEARPEPEVIDYRALSEVTADDLW